MIYTPGLPEEALQPVPVANGMQSQVAVESAASGSVLLTKGREKDLKTEVKLSESVEAPVAKGQQLGKIVYTLDGEVLTEYPITAAGDVEQISFFSALGDFSQRASAAVKQRKSAESPCLLWMKKRRYSSWSFFKG